MPFPKSWWLEPTGLAGAERRPTISTHSTSVVVAEIFGAFTKDARRFQLPEHDAPVFHGDGEFVAFVDVEETSSLSGDDDATEVVNLSHNEGIHS